MVTIFGRILAYSIPPFRPSAKTRKMNPSSSTTFSKTSINVNEDEYSVNGRQSKGKLNPKTRAKKNKKRSQNTKLRGRDQDSPDVRVSKTITWLLRHVAESEGIEMRADGYVMVSEMVHAPSNSIYLK